MKFYKTAISLLLFVLIIPAQISEEALIVHYPFNGNAEDESENQIHGEVYGATLTTDRFGNLNSAYSFDGIDDFIDMSSNLKLKPRPPVTIAFWVNYSSLEKLQPFFTNDFNDMNYFGIAVIIRSFGELNLQYGDGGLIGPDSRTTITAPVPPMNDWFHFVGVIDESLNMKMYLNGVRVQTGSEGSGDALKYSNGHCVIGKSDHDQFADAYFYKGKIDEFRMYNRILTNEEILELAGNPQPVPQYVLSIDNVSVPALDTTTVPVWVEVPEYSELQSFEINISGYYDDADFIGLDFSESDLINTSWKISTNEVLNTLNIAGAASNPGSVTSSGRLCDLKFFVGNNVFNNPIPLVITKAQMNDNSIPILTFNGSIEVIMNNIVYGDVDLNGDVQAIDASLILDYIINLIELDEIQLQAADVTLDNTVSGLDAQIILDYITGNVDQLPFTPDSSLYQFNGNIYMSDIVAYDAENIRVPIFLDGDLNIYSIESDITFDNDVLELTDIEWYNHKIEFSSRYTLNEGLICLAAIGDFQLSSDSLCTLVFSSKNYTEETNVTLERIRVNETAALINPASSKINLVLDVAEDEIEMTFALKQNFPNPFNPTTKIDFTLPETENVKLEVFDLLGRRIATLINDRLENGKHSIEFDAKNLNSGIYVYQIKAGKHISTKKMILLK